MNKAQRIVVILGVLALIYLLAQYYFFYTCPIGVMCSASKQELSMRMIIVIAATAVAAWLLKSDAKAVDAPSEPSQPGATAAPADATAEKKASDAPTESTKLAVAAEDAPNPTQTTPPANPSVDPAPELPKEG